MTVVTTPRAKPYSRWYQRLELPALLPAVLLALLMVWSAVQSIAISGWASGLSVLVRVALPALIVGVVFARLHWLPASLAHILSAALGVAWSVQQVGPLLADEIAREMGPSQASLITSWGDQAAEILIRAISLTRTIADGGRGEDIVLFLIALALLMWSLGYSTAWMLFRNRWTWRAVVLNAITILVNYTFASPKPNTLFFVFLGAALLLVVYQQIINQQHSWTAAQMEFPDFLPLRFVAAAALVCGAVVLVTSLLPGEVSSAQVAQAWRVISSPFTAAREGWETAFSTINAPAGSAGTNFVSRSVRVGGGRTLGDAVVMLVRSADFDYWRANAFDRYNGRGWDNTVGERARAAIGATTTEAARVPLDANSILAPQTDINGRVPVTQTVQFVQDNAGDRLIFGGQLYSANVPVLIQSGFDESGVQPQPNYDELSGVFAQVPIQATTPYTVVALVSQADESGLRAAGTTYPDWVRQSYLQLPDTVTQRTRDLARQIVTDANATTPYDQVLAVQTYLRAFPYDERRPAPADNGDWADEFLFTMKRGYCDDFATSMVVLLRSLDVPARWVQGYAGGTLDPQTGLYTVRESIAHSWPEVYFPTYGWLRFEPTPASYANVPDRPATSDISATTSLTSTTAFSGSIPLSERDRLLQELERDRTTDTNVEELLAAQERARIQQQLTIAAFVVGILLVLIGLGYWLWRRSFQGLSPAAAAFVRISRFGALVGLRQEPHQTAEEYRTMLASRLPEQREPLDRVVGAYVAERYGGRSSDGNEEYEHDWKAMRVPLLRQLWQRLGEVELRKQRPRR